MKEELKNYLEWRFMKNNHPKYLKYCELWIRNLRFSQLQYFEKEMVKLKNNGVYR